MKHIDLRLNTSWVMAALFTGALLIISNVLIIAMNTNQGDHTSSMIYDDPVEIAPSVGIGSYYTRNDGQIENENILFTFESSKTHAEFLESAIRITTLATSEEGIENMISLEIVFPHANQIRPVGVGKLDHYTNFFLGDDPSGWRTGVDHYSGVMYRDIYEDIDLEFSINERGMKYDWIVHPGGNPGIIRQQYLGAVEIQTGIQDELIVRTIDGEFIEEAPFTYQGSADGPAEVDASVTIMDTDVIGYTIGTYDRTRDLIIDPLFLSTFVGSPGLDLGHDVVLDGDDNIYVTGETNSTGFPTTTGSYDESLNGYIDIFVLKLNPTGTSLLYSTFIGGSNDDIGHAIALDGDGNIYIAGETASSDFPTTAGAYDESHNGNVDAFTLKLSSDGTDLDYCTYLGGINWEYGFDLAIDTDKNAYVTGFTFSNNFPTTTGAYDESYNGGTIEGDAFVTKIDNTGSDLVYSTYIGGEDDDLAYTIKLDADGNAFIVGATKSSTDFPLTPGCYDDSYNGGDTDLFALKLNDDGSDLEYSTYIGGGHREGYGFEGYKSVRMCIDVDGNAFVAGYTRSSDFPTTPGCYDSSKGGRSDIAIFKLTSDGSDLDFSTFVGGGAGNGRDFIRDMCLDSEGNVYVVGYTEEVDFPVTPDAYDQTSNSYVDAIMFELNSDGTSLLYSTYFGGDAEEQANGIWLDSNGDIIIVGATYSSDFPTTAGAYDTTQNGLGDVFVLNLAIEEDTTPPEITDVEAQPDPAEAGETVTISCEVTDDRTITDVRAVITGPVGFTPVNTSMDEGSYHYDAVYTIPGTYDYYIYAIDSWGNEADSEVFDFEVEDTTSPVISDVDAQPDPQDAGEEVSITCIVEDNSALSDIRVDITGPGGFSPVNTSMEEGSYHYEAVYPIFGTYNYYIWAVDESGNEAKSAMGSFEILAPDTPVTVWVDDDYDDGTTGWQYDHFDVIQDGIDAVEVGGTVHVEDGSYPENLDVDKPISLLGSGSSTVTILGGGTGDTVLVTSDGVTISGFTITGAGGSPVDAGIHVTSDMNTIQENDLTGNIWSGVFLDSSDDNTVEDNSFSGNVWSGILVDSSTGNTMEGNMVMGSSAGISLTGSPDNEILENTIISGFYGIALLSSSTDTHIEGNTIEDNTHGIYIQDSGAGLIFHNNLLDNTNQATDDDPASTDWHHPDIEEGNYWSDYAGADDGSGVGKHAIAGDGIGDALIPHPGADYDNFPMMAESGWSVNHPPVADANGPYSGEEGTPVLLDASGSYDIDDDDLEYRWDFDNDDTWDTGWSSDPTAAYQWNDDHTGSVKVEVSDGEFTDTDTATVEISNADPVVDAGSAQSAAEGEEVSLDPASFTDAGSDDTHTAEIDWDDGTVEAGTVSEAGGSGTVAGAHTYEEDGIYTVTITVIDDDGGSHSDTLTITVGNADPVVDAGEDQSAQEGETVSLDPASFTDAGILDTHTASIDWGDGTIEAGTVIETDGSGTVSGSHEYGDNGVYTVEVTVTDDDGGTHMDSFTVTVGNEDPVTDAGTDQSADEGETVSLDPSTFTDDGIDDTHIAEIDWGDGTVVSGTVSEGGGSGTVSGDHEYGDNGVYTVTVTVEDDDGGIHEDTLEITVANVSPTVSGMSDESGNPDDDVRIDDIIWTDPGFLDTHTVTIDWDDGDETDLGTQMSPVTGQGHTYTSTGTYTVTVTVTDDDGGVDTTQFEITITDAPDDSTPPEAVIYWDPDTRDIEVYGIDDIDEDVEVTETLISEIENGNTVVRVIHYELEDDAGNTVEVQLEITTVTSTRYTRITAEVEFFRYDGGDDIIPGDHYYDVLFTESSGNGDLLFVRQYIEFKFDFKVITRWYERTGETDIYVYPYGQPSSSETLEDLVIVDIRTSEGDINYHYDT